MQSRGDVSLLAESDIGSPFAFSTAIKGSGPKHNPTLASPRGGSSFYSQESQTNVKSPATNLPNFAEGENEDGEPSLAVTASLSHNESSVGIIDLDAIQSDSSSGQLFLTSPPQTMPNLHFSPTYPTSSAHHSSGGSQQGSTATSSPPLPIRGTQPAKPRASRKPNGGQISMVSVYGGAVSQEVSNASGYFSAPDSSGGQDAKLLHTQHMPPPAVVIAPPPSNEAKRSDMQSGLMDAHVMKSTTQEPQFPADMQATFIGSVTESPYDGLPPELLQGMSALSNSMFSGSDSEGDLIHSAMASALRVYKASNPLFSPDSSLDGVPSLTSPDPPDSYRSTQNKQLDLHNSLHGVGRLPSDGRSAGSVQEHGKAESKGEKEEDKLELDNVGQPQVHLSSAGVVHASTVTRVPAPPSSVPAGGLHAKSLEQRGGILHEQRHLLVEDPVSGRTLGGVLQRQAGSVGDSYGRSLFSNESGSPCHSNESVESMEGLPSTYLHPQDSLYPYDSTDDTTMSVWESPLRSSLPPGSSRTPGVITGSPGYFSSEAMQNQAQGALYNPFDSDNEGVNLTEDFREKEPGSFLEELRKDEDELKLFNASHTTSTQGLSFDHHSFDVTGAEPGREGSPTGEGPLSMSAYFQKHTYSLGQPFSGQQQAEHRPHFSDTPDHVIESPSAPAAGLDDTITGTNLSEEDGDLTPRQVKSTPTLDKTLVDDSGTPKGLSPASNTALDQHNTPLETGQLIAGTAPEHAQFGSQACELTPVLTKYNIPKFSLSETYSFSPTLENSPPDLPAPGVTSSTAAVAPSKVTQPTTSMAEDRTSIITSHPPVASTAFGPTSMLTNRAVSDVTPKAITPLMSSTTRASYITPSPLATAGSSHSSTPKTSYSTLMASSGPPAKLVLTKVEPHPKLPLESMQVPHASPKLEKPGSRNGTADDAASERTAPPSVGPIASGRQVKLMKTASPDGVPIISMEEMRQKLMKLQQDLEEAKASANKLMANAKPSAKVELIHVSSKSKVKAQAGLPASRTTVAAQSGAATDLLSSPASDHQKTSTSASQVMASSAACSPVVSVPPFFSKPFSGPLSNSLAVSSPPASRSTHPFQHPPPSDNTASVSEHTISGHPVPTSYSPLLISTTTHSFSKPKTNPQVPSVSVMSNSKAASLSLTNGSQFQAKEPRGEAGFGMSLVRDAPHSTISKMPNVPETLVVVSESRLHPVCTASTAYSAQITRSTPSIPSTSKTPPLVPISTHSRYPPPTSTEPTLSHPHISSQQLPVSPLIPPKDSSRLPRHPLCEAPPPPSGLVRRVVFSPPKLHRDVAVQSDLLPPVFSETGVSNSTSSSTTSVMGSLAQSDSSYVPLSTQTSGFLTGSSFPLDQSASLALSSKQESVVPSTIHQRSEAHNSPLSSDVDSLVMGRLAHPVNSRTWSGVSVASSTPKEGVIQTDGRERACEEKMATKHRWGQEEDDVVSATTAESWDSLKQEQSTEQPLDSVSAVHQLMGSLGKSSSSHYMPTLPALYTPGHSLANSSSADQLLSLAVPDSRSLYADTEKDATANHGQLSNLLLQVDTTTDRPIYTSPPLSTFSTPSAAASSDQLPAPPPTHSLQVEEVHQFSETCCAGIPATDYIQVTNLGERWLQASVAVRSARVDGQPLTKPAALFTFPQTIYIEHNETRLLKVTFRPLLSGSYEVETDIYASFMIGSDQPRNTAPTASFILRVEVEQPQLELRSHHVHADGNEHVLDYGLMVVGSTMKYPLELINRGQVELPLEVAITCESPQVLDCFKFQSLPESLDISSASSPHSHYLNAIKFALPGRISARGTPRSHTLELSFTPLQYSHTGIRSSLGQPEEVGARLEIKLRGSSSKSGPLQTILLKATVGEAKLCVPRSLEAVTLSCTVGHAVTRVVPICNNGNVPVNAQLTVGGKDPTHFSLGTNSLLLEPNEESQVSVTFDPPTAPLIAEALIQVHIEPGGPSFNVKLRGTAVSQPPPSEGVLSCNKRYLYWGGVALGGAKHMELQLHNSFSTPIPLKLSIRDRHTPFQVDRDEVILLPKEEALIKVNFFPFSTSVFVTALDIVDKFHSKKFRVPLCGYGGISRIEVGGIKFSPESGHQLDIGDIRHSVNKKVKVLMYNSGPRACFVHATCQELNGHTPLPDTHAHISPSILVIPAHSTGEVCLFYRPSKAEEEKCVRPGTPLARLVLQSGDECVRHKLMRAVMGGAGDARQLKVSNAISNFVKDIPSQDKADTDKALISFQLDDMESAFTSHLVLTSITLTSSPKETSQHKSPHRVPPKQELATPKHQPLHPLSPSYTPVESAISSAQVVPPPHLFTIHEEGTGPVPRHDVAILQNRQVKAQDTEKQRHVAKWLSQTKRHLPEPSDPNRENKRISADKKMVYLSKSFIQFPDTEVGSRAMFKVPVNNRDSIGHSMEVIKPSAPFSVNHRTFNLGSRMSARLPVYFTPTYSGVFEGILAIRSQSGHQAFAQLRGRATP